MFLLLLLVSVTMRSYNDDDISYLYTYDIIRKYVDTYSTSKYHYRVQDISR